MLGSPDRAARIVLHGIAGPIKVGKRMFDGEMPGLKALDDEQNAGVPTYVRREWGHEAGPVDVASTRQATAGRGDQQWTTAELQKVK